MHLSIEKKNIWVTTSNWGKQIKNKRRNVTYGILWFVGNSCLLFLSNDTIRYLLLIQNKREFVQNLLNFQQNNHWHCSVVPDHCCRERNQYIRLGKVKHMNLFRFFLMWLFWLIVIYLYNCYTHALFIYPFYRHIFFSSCYL